MIGFARFQNFKALGDVEITFESRLTVLVGPNGSGKSSVLRGLDLLCRLTNAGACRQKLGLLASKAKTWHGGQDGNLLLEVHEGTAGHQFAFHSSTRGDCRNLMHTQEQVVNLDHALPVTP